MSNIFLIYLQPALHVLGGIVCLTDNCPLHHKHTFLQEFFETKALISSVEPAVC